MYRLSSLSITGNILYVCPARIGILAIINRMANLIAEKGIYLLNYKKVYFDSNGAVSVCNVFIKFRIESIKISGISG